MALNSYTYFPKSKNQSVDGTITIYIQQGTKDGRLYLAFVLDSSSNIAGGDRGGEDELCDEGREVYHYCLLKFVFFFNSTEKKTHFLPGSCS